jgi:hypothetical protein
MKTLHITLGLLCGLLPLAEGCSEDPHEAYSVTDQYRGGICSVCVPVWTRGKDVYRRGLEMRLTEAIVKRVQLDTPYTVIPKQRADTILNGNIDEIEQRVLSFNPDTGEPRELEITLVITFTWTDLRDGKVLAEARRMRISGNYVVARPFNEDFFQGSEDAINRAARQIVEKMEAPW